MNVRFGPIADICSAPTHVRFTPESRHVRCNDECPLRAKSGHSLQLPAQSSSNAEPYGGEDQQTANDVINGGALTQKQRGKYHDGYGQDVRYQGGTNGPEFRTEEREPSVRTKSRNSRKKEICDERTS